jgi:hypothetical protein
MKTKKLTDWSKLALLVEIEKQINEIKTYQIQVKDCLYNTKFINIETIKN